MYLYVFTHLVIHINISIEGGNKGGRGGNGSSRGEEEAIYVGDYPLINYYLCNPTTHAHTLMHHCWNC